MKSMTKQAIWNRKHRKEQKVYKHIYHQRLFTFAHKYMKEHNIKYLVPRKTKEAIRNSFQ